jgi:CheY-like chemotaxis protein
MMANRKILIVDDLADVRELMRIVLERDGWLVLEASDGKQVVEVVLAEHPDVILMDVMMAHLDGIEACHRIKSDPQLARVPVIIYTTVKLANTHQRALEAGADYFMTKPFTTHELLYQVNLACNCFE